MARPSKYTDEILKEICDRLSLGEDLETICKSEHLPCADTVHLWKCGKTTTVDKDKVFQAIAHAREVGYDAIARDARLIARGKHPDSTGDTLRDKLIIETDLKLLAKWFPSKYGDKTAVEHSGSLNLSLAERLDIARNALKKD